MYQRYLSQKLLQSTKDSPVTLLSGARQTGKSTLVQSLFKDTHKYYTLDDINILNLVLSDPLSFLNGQTQPIIIDEIQRCSDLLIPIKKKIDENRQPGQFVLTGSANVLELPKLSESLVGRMEIHTLWPLSPVEIYDTKTNFIDKIFGDLNFGRLKHDFMDIFFKGGYPDVLKRETEERKNDWCHSYIQTLLSRDVRDLANIEKLSELPDLLALLATRTSSLLNISELSRSTTLPQTTLKRYLNLLKLFYLVTQIPPWSKNLSKRHIKSPKVFINDIRLLLYLMGMTQDAVLSQRTLFGQILENFVAQELMKQQTWAKKRTKLFHYRTQSGQEIDFILEGFDGCLVAIEVKAAQTLTPKFFEPIKNLQKEVPVIGIVLYTGQEILPYGKDLWALPLSTLWS